MNIKAIKNDDDYREALLRIEDLMDAEFGTEEGDELDVLSTLVDVYENENFPIEEPDPVEFLKHAMEFKGENQSSLSKVLKSRSRANEIINKHRSLTLAHIRKIVHAWNIPATPLIREYSLIKTTSREANMRPKRATSRAKAAARRSRKKAIG